jgi:hypothetical protein
MDMSDRPSVRPSRSYMTGFLPRPSSMTTLGAGGECPKMWASRSYILPRWAIPETRCWAIPRDPPSVGHPCALHRAPVHPRRAPVHSPLGTCPGIRLPYSPTGYRGCSVGPFRRATPSGIEFISSASLLTIVFIHFQESSSTDHKMHPLSRKLITCSEISSSVEKFHPLFRKCTYCVASLSFAYQIHPLLTKFIYYAIS